MTAEEISESFIKALLAEDEVGCVIRSHLYIEAQINRYLELAVIEPKYLTKLGLSYAKKVELLCCLGFDQQFRGILIGIGKLRNKFAHNLSSRLTQQVVNDLYNALPEFGRHKLYKTRWFCSIRHSLVLGNHKNTKLSTQSGNSYLLH